MAYKDKERQRVYYREWRLAHWDERREYKRKWYQENSCRLVLKDREIRKKRREDGKCTRCGDPLMGGDSFCCVNCCIQIPISGKYSRRNRRELYEVNHKAVACKS